MIFQILYESMTDELLHAYAVNFQISEITPEHYFLWVKNEGSKNPNYALGFDFIFNILHPLFLFRAACRQCNDEVENHKKTRVYRIYKFHQTFI